MRTRTVTLTGDTPMLMHHDNIEWADKMKEWEGVPANKATSKAGDDRTPAFRWIGCLYWDDFKKGTVTIPFDCVTSCLRGGAAKVPTGKKQQTFKALSQTGITCEDFHWPLLVNGKTISMADISGLMEEATFREHVEMVEALGFSLFTKRAKIGIVKHVRVRPRFDNWSLRGELTITDPQITDEALQTILDQAGRTQGLGDWRPGGKTPGPWGMFTATMEK